MLLGANFSHDTGCEFGVWAPHAEDVALHLPPPVARTVAMQPQARGYWHLNQADLVAGTDYLFRLNQQKDYPDPASHWQPDGVHQVSRVVDHAGFRWSDQGWRGRSLDELILYELHVGTFTPAGTFDAVIPHLAELADLGITAIELMPVAQFPGARNWGYDGVHPFAVQNSYGGPAGLKRLVDACHRTGLAVVLDVVYNHLGPEGNYLREFGPYFTDRYHSPWGEAVNFDAAGSDEVRRYFIENARHWFLHYHVDALRLDAIHAIYDFSARPFLQQLAAEIGQLGSSLARPCLLIAESDLNDSRVIRAPQLGGYGLDAQWNDDFHHALHGLLTGEKQGYYQDFGRTGDLTAVLSRGFAYDWRYSSFRRRSHGNSAADLPGRQFVAFNQNHDQVGNRPQGERLLTLAGFEGAKLAAAAMLTAPFIPLLFMGEEYGETNPFRYFVSFLDPRLNQAVREGRAEEFQAFDWPEELPDPAGREAFEQSMLDRDKRGRSPGRELLAFYRRLMLLRREIPALHNLSEKCSAAAALEEARIVWMMRRDQESRVLVLMNFAETGGRLSSPAEDGNWQKQLDSADVAWLGAGAVLPERMRAGDLLDIPARSCAVYTRLRVNEPVRPGERVT